MQRQPTRNDYIVLFALGALWGSSFGAIKIALHGVTPLTVMSVRILLAGAALLLLILVRKTPLPRGIQNWIKIGWMALFGTLIPFFLVPWGQLQIDSSLAAILMAVNPLFALTLGHFFSEHESFTLRQLLAMLVGFSGILLVFGENAISSINGNIWAQLAVIGAGFCYTISGVIVSRVRGASADSVSASIFICSSVIVFPLWMILEQPWSLHFETESLLALTHLGLVSTGMAFLMRYYIILRAGAVFLSYVAFIIPMFGILFGILFLGETISANTMGAVVLILSGVFLGRK
ncbi:MAG: EamA family transporter [Deltaproteobacteria bacterium]|jgi:drug/metabolite transporter (DMT)-like permease|nr:EamA family transporter [Deltaproteobacteria bacterium]MDG1860181.1 EamA family transporter [SAR324 cluster bacterium]MBT4015588.1 EamA family transporter [Deltaproteobacteria bacterium]MBT4184610.1 EamA family transporter [Deltaproteobacteria bacterium]MBT4628930.1 EamA family transporter [Deltaproteobacteria bacterium]